MRTLSPWLHKRASAFGSDKGIIFSSNFWLHTARFDVHEVPGLPHRDCSHAPRTCSPNLKIELTSTWSHQSKLSMTSRCRRSWNRFWRKSTEGKSKRVKSNSCGQQDRGGHLLQSYLQNIQRNLKKKLMKTTRLGFPMTCALSYISIVLPDIVPDGWYFYMFVTPSVRKWSTYFD